MVPEALTPRERLLRTLHFQPVDRPPDLEWRAWPETVRRWRKEGMELEDGANWAQFSRYFGIDEGPYGPSLGIETCALPAFQHTVLEERGEHRIVQDEDGAIAEELQPELGESIPRYIRFAIETRADWRRLRDERLDPGHPGRVPADAGMVVRELEAAGQPITASLGSLYGVIRNWMGVERLSVALYDDRPLVEEMMEHLTRVTLAVLERLAQRGGRIDVGRWWEDMCYNHGPLISPRLFAELMLPRYQRITRFAREALGTEFHLLDCDGNIHELASLWLEGGINMMIPLEAAHTDAVRLGREFGRRILLRGAFDKRALAAGPAAIDAEFERLRPLFERGGYICQIDHAVPPDVSLANYLYYRRRKLQIIGKPWPGPGL